MIVVRETEPADSPVKLGPRRQRGDGQKDKRHRQLDLFASQRHIPGDPRAMPGVRGYTPRASVTQLKTATTSAEESVMSEVTGSSMELDLVPSVRGGRRGSCGETRLVMQTEDGN